MQASDRVLAARYGKALFEAAAAKREEARVQADLAGAGRAIADILPVLRHPRVSSAQKKARLEGALGGKVAATTLKFLGLLIDKKRFDLLPVVVVELDRLIALKNNTATAKVRTARPLSSADQQKLAERLKTFAGKDITLEIKEDPELIGGVIVRLGDWVLDSSLRGGLRQMKEAFNGN
jgi:F-type H+-transporting ATPase subunit delta